METLGAWVSSIHPELSELGSDPASCPLEASSSMLHVPFERPRRRVAAGILG